MNPQFPPSLAQARWDGGGDGCQWWGAVVTGGVPSFEGDLCLAGCQGVWTANIHVFRMEPNASRASDWGSPHWQA